MERMKNILIVVLLLIIGGGIFFIAVDDKESLDEKTTEVSNSDPLFTQNPENEQIQSSEIYSTDQTSEVDSSSPPLYGPFTNRHPLEQQLPPGQGIDRHPNAPNRMVRLRKEFPQLAENLEELRRIAVDVRLTVRRYHEATKPEEKTKYENQLKKILKKEFDLEVQRQHYEIEYMELRIERLKELVERFEKEKKTILEYRLNRFLFGPKPQSLNFGKKHPPDKNSGSSRPFDDIP